MKKRMFTGLLFMSLFWAGGCGADKAAEETFHEEMVVNDVDAQDEGQNAGGERNTETEQGAGTAQNTETAQGADASQQTKTTSNNVQIQSPELEMDEATREELTTQLLLENELDTSVIESAGATDGCTFSLPDGFEEAEDMPGMYVTKRYPIDASTIYYVEMDKDISLQLLTEDTFLEQMQSNLQENYDLEIAVDVKSFEKITISGCPAFRILCSYMIDGIEITHLEYTINADKSYIITYSQTNEYDRMDEFEASAATIQLQSDRLKN